MGKKLNLVRIIEKFDDCQSSIFFNELSSILYGAAKNESQEIAKLINSAADSLGYISQNQFNPESLQEACPFNAEKAKYCADYAFGLGYNSLAKITDRLSFTISNYLHEASKIFEELQTKHRKTKNYKELKNIIIQ